jgi:selenocysteine lyase/cysteine desulfurase
MNPQRAIALTQVERRRQLERRTTTELQLLLHRALSPEEARRAALKERPVLDRLRVLDLEGPDPADLRAELWATGGLSAEARDLEYRRLFPALDIGIYLANHAIGKPSDLSRFALDQFQAQHAVFGVTGFVDAGWLDLVNDARHLVGALSGDPELTKGDVAFFPSLSDALGATLSSLRGELVTTEAHFTTGHYIHGHWAERTGGRVVLVPQDRDECVPTAALVGALSPRTTIVSLSQVHWRSGWRHEIEEVAAAMRRICPDAALLFDVYQGHGTVPVDVADLPRRTAILGGGVKQLHAGTGTGYAWLSNAMLADHAPDRVGWWTHAEPMAFEGALRLGDRAAKLRTGPPALLPLVLLATELKVFATLGGGSLPAAVDRARRRTRSLVEGAVSLATDLGLRVRGPRDPERRGAFFAVEVEDGPAAIAGLADRGVVADFRADGSGPAGLVRISASAAHLDYELAFGVEALAEVAR